MIEDYKDMGYEGGNTKANPTSDSVSHPTHYTTHPAGIECIQITEHMNFCLGNAIKYIWRAGLKGNTIEDLQKAIWYLNREIKRLGNSPYSYKKAPTNSRGKLPTTHTEREKEKKNII